MTWFTPPPRRHCPAPHARVPTVEHLDCALDPHHPGRPARARDGADHPRTRHDAADPLHPRPCPPWPRTGTTRTPRAARGMPAPRPCPPCPEPSPSYKSPPGLHISPHHHHNLPLPPRCSRRGAGAQPRAARPPRRDAAAVASPETHRSDVTARWPSNSGLSSSSSSAAPGWKGEVVVVVW